MNLIVDKKLRSESDLIDGITLQGVEFNLLANHADERGWFREIFVSHRCDVIEPEQWSVVHSKANVLRGMHYHKRHDEFFSLVQGHCLVALKDIRPDSKTCDQFSIYELTDTCPAALAFPRGILHGWFFYRDSIHMQAVSESYDSYHLDDNNGCHWNAPDLGFSWPIPVPSVSQRASNFGSVAELRKKVGLS